jgi:predicted acyltransferase
MRTATTATAPIAVTRLTSLDVFRGLTMASMVIVNNPGDWDNVYAPLLHAEWHGWTPTDLIFPFFLFIVGVSITLSNKSGSWPTILRRAGIIFGLGLFLSGYPHFDLTRWRIPGVLQRIALCYLFAAGTYYLIARNQHHAPRRHDDAVASAFRRKIVLPGFLALILALAYWALLMLVPPPGGAAGDLSPEGNLGAHVDRALMANHLWKPRWDPEGLLSTIPAISTTLLGLIAGLWLGSSASRQRKAAGVLIAGAAGIVVGLLWGAVFPINKPLWTSSYTVFTAGAAAVLLGLCYWAIDVRGWRAWTKPFVILGSNAIALFVVSGLLVETLALIQVAGPDGNSISASDHAYLHYFAPLASPKNASLLYAIANLAVLFALLAWLYRRRIFLRV